MGNPNCTLEESLKNPLPPTRKLAHPTGKVPLLPGSVLSSVKGALLGLFHCTYLVLEVKTVQVLVVYTNCFW
jgi:hypothetical protein